MEVIKQLVQRIVDFFADIPDLVPSLLSVLLGALLVIWGYKLFRLWLFALGAQSGYALGRIIVEKGQMSGTLAYLIIGLCVIGIAVLFWVGLRFSFAVAGFVLGVFLFWRFGGLLINAAPLWLLLVFGLIGAVLAYFFVRLFIVAGSSFYGAFLLTDGLFSLIAKSPAGSFINSDHRVSGSIPTVMTILTVVFIVLGFIYQYNVSGKGSAIKLGIGS